MWAIRSCGGQPTAFWIIRFDKELRGLQLKLIPCQIKSTPASEEMRVETAGTFNSASGMLMNDCLRLHKLVLSPSGCAKTTNYIFGFNIYVNVITPTCVGNR